MQNIPAPEEIPFHEFWEEQKPQTPPQEAPEEEHEIPLFFREIGAAETLARFSEDDKKKLKEEPNEDETEALAHLKALIDSICSSIRSDSYARLFFSLIQSQFIQFPLFSFFFFSDFLV